VIFYEGGVYGHQKDQVEKFKYVLKSKSILNDGIVVDNDHGQPNDTLIPSASHPPNSPSSSSSVSREIPTSSPSPNRKMRRLVDIYERSAI